jgi:hypothetical protein
MPDGGSTIAGIAADTVVGAGCELHDPACDTVIITGCAPAAGDGSRADASNYKSR